MLPLLYLEQWSVWTRTRIQRFLPTTHHIIVAVLWFYLRDLHILLSVFFSFLCLKDVLFFSLPTEFSVLSLESEISARFLLHAVQLMPLSSFKEQEFFQFFTLAPLAEKTLSFPVKVSTEFYN